MDGFYIRECKTQAMTASGKAHEDTEYFLHERGYTELIVHDGPDDTFWHRLTRHLRFFADWRHIYKTVTNGSVLVIQHPLKLKAYCKSHYLQKLRRKKGVKTVFLIHDLESLRGMVKAAHIVQADAELDALSDGIICHNDRMKAHLTKMGIRESKIVTLELFDYRLGQMPDRPVYPKNTVIVAGNLDPRKSVYVYSLHEAAGVRFHLFGIKYDDSEKYENVTYHGAFDPEELVAHLEGAFGLVWDGDSIDTCAGQIGNYLQYNNPHKLSLYMAAGIPAVVWDRSAVSEFVKKYGVGVAVSSLRDLPAALAALSEEDYARMVQNAAAVSEKVRAGAFLNAAMDRVTAAWE